MAGTISFAGIGSNIDVQGIVDALVKAESGNQTQMQQKAKDLNAASSSISDISSALSSLGSALGDLSDAGTMQTYSATSSGAEVATSIFGAPQAGTYSVEVLSTAKEFRAYSNTLAASQSAPANLTGLLHIAVGSNSSADINISANDSVSDIVNKINQSGLRVSATTFFDGSDYRLQLRGLDAGGDNKISLSGLDLGFMDNGNLVQQASDAHVKVDGLDVYSKNNQITGAIPGVTMAVTKETTAPLSVTVSTDPNALVKKVQSVITAYNAVIGKVHAVAGYGTTAASVTSLAGDATLRSLTDRMSNAVLTQVNTGTQYDRLSTIGISLQRDGTLQLDQTKLSSAIAQDSLSVTKLLAGDAKGQGVMDVMNEVADAFTQYQTGILKNKSSALDDSANDWKLRAQQEQDRLQQYQNTLLKQFQAMNDTVTSNTSTMNYLTQLYGGSSTGSSK